MAFESILHPSKPGITDPRGEVGRNSDHIHDGHIDREAAGTQPPLGVVVPVVRPRTRRVELHRSPGVSEGEGVHGPHGAARVRAVGQEPRLDLQPSAEGWSWQGWVSPRTEINGGGR